MAKDTIDIVVVAYVLKIHSFVEELLLFNKTRLYLMLLVRCLHISLRVSQSHGEPLLLPLLLLSDLVMLLRM